MRQDLHSGNGRKTRMCGVWMQMVHADDYNWTCTAGTRRAKLKVTPFVET